MKFSIEVGEGEKNRLEYNFNQFLGTLAITVNGKPIKKSVRLINEPIVEVHVLVVGQTELFEVRIEKERRHLLGQRNRVFVNNRLVKVMEGV